MTNGDIFTSPIEFAIGKALKTLGNSEEDRIIKEGLKRSAKILEAIRIHGLQTCGMTYDQFCKQFEQKKTAIFMTDEEVERYNKAVKIMNVLSE
ncbi:MAG: hypothetical protein HFH72_08700 [Lachnospiraceae bacterium]|nr:hypothetical protein [Lachnospiraceae bacterium]